MLRGGPWPFDNQVLMVRRWQAGMTAKDVKFNVVGLWVQIWGVPFDMVCPQVAREVGSRLGMVEEVFYWGWIDSQLGRHSSTRGCRFSVIIVVCWVMTSSTAPAILLLQKMEGK